MNANTAKTVGLYVGGALVGAMVGAVVGSLIVDQILANENGPTQEIEGEAAEGETSEPDPSLQPLKRLPKQRKVVVDYTKFSKADDGKDDLTELVKKYAGKEEPLIPDLSAPYVISVEDYSEAGENNNKVTLTYYELDDILTDQTDRVITDVEKHVGSDALLKFGMNSDDEDIVYVRNSNLETDFEVIRVHKSYAETVAGFPEEERRPKKVKSQDADEE